MPELPEVETIMRSLRDGGAFGMSIVGKKVSNVEVLWQRSIALPSVDLFCSQLTGQTIQALDRRGKFLLVRFNVDTLLIHLRMSGDLRSEFISVESPLRTHDRVIINFTDNSRLVFNDTRKFGRVWLTNDAAQVTGELGPEPFSETLTPVVLYEMLHRHQRMLKPLLLDQHFMAGLGNIYTDEALFLAGIHPCTLSSSVTMAQVERLLQAIRKVLNQGIRTNGASIDWVYRGGEFQNHFQVYQRTGEVCAVCGSSIQRIVVGQRGTHFCPICQPLQEV